MDFTKYRSKLIGTDDERAVSPVIGVILMVAITVILAAVIAAFVLDIGDLDDSAPNSQFDWETVGEDEVEVTLTSGDNIDISALTINGADGGHVDGEGEINGGPVHDNGEWTAGETLELDTESGADEVQIVWAGDGSSTVISDYDL